MTYDYDALYAKSFAMRKRFLELFTKLGFGHVTSAFSITEIVITLYTHILRYRIDDKDWQERDRFVLSKGHGAGMLFPVFEDAGLVSAEELETALKIGGNQENLLGLFYPGFDFYGGSLGIGLGMAAGLAMGAKLGRKSWLTFCIVGDAECYEGAIWEAAMFAGHNRLNNLVVIVDRNGLGCSDFTEDMLALEPFADKWKACGFVTKEVDGHSYEELLEAFSGIRTKKNAQPLCIIANTVKGKGLDYLSNIPLMHGYMPKGDEIERAFDSLY